MHRQLSTPFVIEEFQSLSCGERTPSEGPLRERMEERFARLKTKAVVGIIFDVDHNLTLAQSVRIAPEGLKLIRLLRSKGVPIMINSGRRYQDPQDGSFDERDLRTVHLDIEDHLNTSSTPAEEREEILKHLYIAAEGGMDVRNGFRESEKGKFRRFDTEVFSCFGVTRNERKEAALHEFLANLPLEQFGLPWKERLRKRFMYTVRGEHKDMLAMRPLVLEALSKAALWDERTMTAYVGGIGLDIAYYPIDKRSSFAFLEHILGIRDTEDEVVLAIGDAGEKGGNDYPMLAGRQGGLSTERFDPEDSHMIALSLISDCEPGLRSVIWALKQLRFKALNASGRATT